MRIGSLFSGAGGLDMAVAEVFGGEIVWHAEIDKAASKVLAHRFPGVPNLGDITAVEWADVPAVDVLCGGFPCQDVSAAGKRAGIKQGTRSGLWSVFADAIDALRPRYVVVENVRGLLSATAHRDMESADSVVGDGSDRPVLRAIGAVLGDLHDCGYDAQWATVAAADVGAPHRRDRVFILAAASDRQGGAGDGLQQQDLSPVCGRWDAEQQQPRVCSCGCSACGGVAADPAVRGWEARQSESEGLKRQPVTGSCGTGADEPGVALLPTPNAQDGNGGVRYSSDGHQSTLPGEVRLLPTPRSARGASTTETSYALGGQRTDDNRTQGEVLLPTPRTSDTNGAGQHGDGGMDLRTTISLLPTPRSRHGDSSESGLRRNSPGIEAVTYHFPEAQWGKYAPAIARWEAVVGPAPAPTEPNKNGNPRLSAAFSQWLMGWPAGWVTDPAIGISRNDQLRIVGNGVCPQQAAHALRFLLSISEIAA